MHFSHMTETEILKNESATDNGSILLCRIKDTFPNK